MTRRLIHPAEYRERILTLIELRKLRLAIREARRALEQNPEDAEAHRLLAWAIWEQGNPKAAEAPARMALRLSPERASVHSTLALILEDLKKHKEAQSCHERAIELAPRSADNHVRYARFLLTTRCNRSVLFGNPILKRALEHIDLALQIDPHNESAHILRAAILRIKRRFADAEASAGEALRAAPNSYYAHVALGDAYTAQEQHGKALACYREAIRLDPSNDIVEQKLLWAAKRRIPIYGAFFRNARIRVFSKRQRALLRISSALSMVFWVAICTFAGASSIETLVCLAPMTAWLLVFFVVSSYSDPLIRKGVMEGWIK